MYIQTESEVHIMGDMQKKAPKKTLEERAAEREARKQETVHIENETIDNLSGEKEAAMLSLYQIQEKKVPVRDKAITARVNGEIFEQFKEICKKNNMTANSCLNMLIERYVNGKQ